MRKIEFNICKLDNIEMFPKIEKQNTKNFKIIYGVSVDMLENDFIIPITIIVKNQKGLKNLYKIISRIKTDNLEKYDKQVIIRNDLLELSDGLLYGLDILGMKDIYDNQTDKQVSDDIMWYDFIEIKPLENYKEYIKRIINIALDYRKIIIGLSEEDYLKSTSEFKNSFKFINNDKLVLDIVVNNINKLSNLIDDIKINSNKLYLPKIDNSKNILLDMIYLKAYEMYGKPLPKLIQNRLNEELYGKDNKNGIINLHYENIFLINKSLVEYSHSLGYPVCARGNVSSSLVAYFIGLTNINPLPPHYYCTNCNNTIFVNDDVCGLDLPNKKCPICNKDMKKDGFNISYKYLLGEDVNKIPNIYINYSMNIKDELNNYLINMFGEDKVYNAGVVGIKPKNDKNIKIIGKHPSCIFIIPKEKSIYDFTPITYPLDNKKYSKVTYFDYHDLDKMILKVNILFHDSVNALKELEDITHINSNEINFNDKKTMELINSGNTDNILEFEKDIVKSIIKKEKPNSIKELINIVIKAHSNEEYTMVVSHASSYVSLAYKLAWYKTYYPKEFEKISTKYKNLNLI